MNKVLKNKLNEQIKTSNIRVVGDEFAGLYDLKTALKIAEDNSFDLIEISYNEKTDTSICKIMEYNKYLYEIKKKEKTNKVEMKEIQLSYNIAENDINTKLKQTEKFLKDNCKVKLTLMLKGREQTFKENAQLTFYSFIDKISGFGIPEHLPKYEGNKYITILKKK